MTGLDLTQALLAIFRTPGPDGAPRRRSELEAAFPFVMLSVWQRFAPDDVPPELAREMEGVLDALAIPRAPGPARDAAIGAALAQADVDPRLVDAVVDALDLPTSETSV